MAARIPEDPLAFWLERLDPESRPANQSHFNRWMNWLHKQASWENATPRELLIRHLDSADTYSSDRTVLARRLPLLSYLLSSS